MAKSLLYVHQCSEDLDICEANVRGSCASGIDCQLHHSPLPHLWQCKEGGGGQWISMYHESEDIERAFSDPSNDSYTVQVIKNITCGLDKIVTVTSY